VNSPLFKIARVLVRLDHVVSIIIEDAAGARCAHMLGGHDPHRRFYAFVVNLYFAKFARVANSD
jgi:hypothetical protein